MFEKKKTTTYKLTQNRNTQEMSIFVTLVKGLTRHVYITESCDFTKCCPEYLLK